MYLSYRESCSSSACSSAAVRPASNYATTDGGSNGRRRGDAALADDQIPLGGTANGGGHVRRVHSGARLGSCRPLPVPARTVLLPLAVHRRQDGRDSLEPQRRAHAQHLAQVGVVDQRLSVVDEVEEDLECAGSHSREEDLAGQMVGAVVVGAQQGAQERGDGRQDEPGTNTGSSQR